MRQQKPPRIDVHDRQTLRTRQYDDIELLVAASEAEIMCAGWLFERRVSTEQSLS